MKEKPILFALRKKKDMTSHYLNYHFKGETGTKRECSPKDEFSFWQKVTNLGIL